MSARFQVGQICLLLNPISALLLTVNLNGRRLGKQPRACGIGKRPTAKLMLLILITGNYLIISCRNHLWMHMVMERCHIWTPGWHG